MKVQKLSESFDMTRVSPYVLSEDLLMEAEPSSGLSDAEKKAQAKQDRRNDKLMAKAAKVLAKDYDRVCARATFYIDHNYSKGKTQAQWRQWTKDQQEAIDKEKDSNKKAEMQKKFDAQRHNALVVNDTGFFIRRGSEWLLHSLEEFVPGVNDKIGTGYFREPYKYGGKKGATVSGGAPKPKSAGGSSGGTKKVGTITEQNFKKFIQFAKILDIQLLDANKKEVKLDDAEFEKFSTYIVKNKSVELPLPEWLAAVKKARPF